LRTVGALLRPDHARGFNVGHDCEQELLKIDAFLSSVDGHHFLPATRTDRMGVEVTETGGLAGNEPSKPSQSYSFSEDVAASARPVTSDPLHATSAKAIWQPSLLRMIEASLLSPSELLVHPRILESVRYNYDCLLNRGT
jgi:hypothetical protein